MSQIEELSVIKDVFVVTLQPFEDERGRFMETFRKEWFPQRSWEAMQSNRSDSRAGVLRGLHYHFQQVDYWHVVKGKIRAALYDLRPDSPTSGTAYTLEMDAEGPVGLFIPVGVAHGFVALADATLIYIVDKYYDGRDEFGVAWNDPDIALPWGVDEPMVSARDAANPLLKDIPRDKLPGWQKSAA
jgi:dTDP-4-dehydrorhamnose 3,5-epimerase